MYWQAYCVLAGPSCDGCEQIVRQQNFCTRIRQQKYTSRQPKSDRKMYQRLLWKKPGGCHTEGAGLALCLARARASTRLNRFATLAPTNMHEAFLLQERGASIFWRRGEGQEAIVPYCQGRNVSIAKGHRQQAAGQCGGKPPCPHGRGSGIRISISPPLIEIHGVLLLAIGSKTPLFLGS